MGQQQVTGDDSAGQHSEVVSLEDSSPKIPRRRFLKIAATGAASAALSVPILGPLQKLGSDTKVESEEHEGPRLRKWTMIIDLEFCDGCRSIGKPPQCTTACIEGHFVPEPQEWIEVFEFDLHGGGTQFVPTPCQQCQNAPCVNVCPVGATWTTPEGITLIDQNRCIGCRFCMAACPYSRRFFNWGQPPIPPESLFFEYNVERQMPAKKGVVMKCDFCPEMARAGRMPYCVIACPNNAIYYGDLEEDVATNGKGVVSVSLLLADRLAYRLKEELGTKPRVYYLPGHGHAVGRGPYETGRLPTQWPWVEKIEGATTWTR